MDNHILQNGLLHGLNDEQRAAVTATEGPVIIFAGPGSGKTRVITYRIAYLIEHSGVPPWNILAVTFTNKAAREMRERLAALVPDQAKNLTIGTFHSICARILRSEIETLDFGRSKNFTILDDDEQNAIIRECMRQQNLDEKKFKPVVIRAEISRAKNALQSPRQFLEQTTKYIDEIAGRVYEDYEKSLRAQNAVDFDDLIFITHSLWRRDIEARLRAQKRYRYIHVDEFQDCNTAQYELMRLLAAPPRNLPENIVSPFQAQRNICVVGDEDQGIYSWRGASSQNIISFEQDFPDRTEIMLMKNYRSSGIILDAAANVVQENRNRKPKKLIPTLDRGAPIVVKEVFNEEHEGRYIAETVQKLTQIENLKLADFAVMYRTNAQSRAIEDQFMALGVPYKIIGSRKFYERKEIRDIIAYLRLLENPNDLMSFRRIINVPARKIGPVTLQEIVRWAQSQQFTLPEACERIQENTQLGNAAKGAVLSFGNIIKQLKEIAQKLPVAQLIDELLVRTGYITEIRDGSDEGEERYLNILELQNVAKTYAENPYSELEGLAAFLETVALVGGADISQNSSDNPTMAEEQRDAVTLITLHAAKGLEFPIVFIAGMEENVLPHQRSLEDREQLEEERRLAYVGITRAMKRLFLLHAFRRSFYGGNSMIMEQSRFIKDIPANLLETQAYERTPYNGSSRAGSGAESYSGKAAGKPSPETHLADEDMAKEQRRAVSIGKGSRVRHKVYGKGIVLDISHTSQSTMVEVLFERENIGRRVLDMEFAKLESLD